MSYANTNANARLRMAKLAMQVAELPEPPPDPAAVEAELAKGGWQLLALYAAKSTDPMSGMLQDLLQHIRESRQLFSCFPDDAAMRFRLLLGQHDPEQFARLPKVPPNVTVYRPAAEPTSEPAPVPASDGVPEPNPDQHAEAPEMAQGAQDTAHMPEALADRDQLSEALSEVVTSRHFPDGLEIDDEAGQPGCTAAVYDALLARLEVEQSQDESDTEPAPRRKQPYEIERQRRERMQMASPDETPEDFAYATQRAAMAGFKRTQNAMPTLADITFDPRSR